MRDLISLGILGIVGIAAFAVLLPIVAVEAAWVYFGEYIRKKKCQKNK